MNLDELSYNYKKKLENNCTWNNHYYDETRHLIKYESVCIPRELRTYDIPPEYNEWFHYSELVPLGGTILPSYMDPDTPIKFNILKRVLALGPGLEYLVRIKILADEDLGIPYDLYYIVEFFIAGEIHVTLYKDPEDDSEPDHLDLIKKILYRYCNLLSLNFNAHNDYKILPESTRMSDASKYIIQNSSDLLRSDHEYKMYFGSLSHIVPNECHVSMVSSGQVTGYNVHHIDGEGRFDKIDTQYYAEGINLSQSIEYTCHKYEVDEYEVDEYAGINIFTDYSGRFLSHGKNHDETIIQFNGCPFDMVLQKIEYYKLSTLNKKFMTILTPLGDLIGLRNK